MVNEQFFGDDEFFQPRLGYTLTSFPIFSHSSRLLSHNNKIHRLLLDYHGSAWSIGHNGHHGHNGYHGHNGHHGHHGHKSYYGHHGHHGHQGHQGHNAISVIMFISILTHQSHINKVRETSFIHITSRASCDAKKCHNSKEISDLTQRVNLVDGISDGEQKNHCARDPAASRLRYNFGYKKANTRAHVLS